MTLALPRQISHLLRGRTSLLQTWTDEWSVPRALLCAGLIMIGAGCFGAAVGSWRAPLQALYCAAKLPLILLLTTIGNGILNAMLAPLLGLNLPARQSLLAVLVSFTLAAVILGAFSPLLAFLIWNLPPLDSPAGNRVATHSVILLVETGMIAFAGLAANIRLVQLLQTLSGHPATARRILIAWLLGNLFLGSQLAWMARPFVGSPGLPVEFIRQDALAGSFFEALLRAAGHLLFP